jgi:hypothetical protein
MKMTATIKNRTRRTPEQIVADLEAEITRVKARAAAKEAKAAPEVKPLMAAVKAVEKALVAASGAGNTELVESLTTVRETLGAEQVRMGLIVS